MNALLEAFWLPKNGSSDAEYEDAFFPVAPRHISGGNLRFAIADGATEASFSKLWAKQLVRAFVRRKLGVPVALDELQPLQALWERVVSRRKLTWYAEEKAAKGAFGAFLGVEFSEESTAGRVERKWRATAAGDCCLVQVREEGIVAAFPMETSAEFRNNPHLLSSKPSNNTSRENLVLEKAGSFRCEDIFLLMTDALACWFFSQQEAGERPWDVLRDIGNDGHMSLQDLVVEQRARKTSPMRDDDVTLMRITIEK